MCNIIGSNFTSSLYENYYTKYKPRHLEYFPLVNARAHSFGDENKSKILHNEFRRQYDAFLMSTIEKTDLDSSDKLCYTYFLLLQDRINEAIEIFEEVDPKSLPEDGSLSLQYDYTAAYLDFYIGHDTDYKVARDTVQKYKNYPVLHWRFLFEEVEEQLKEYDGVMDIDHQINQEEEDSKDKNLKKSMELEPYLHSELKGKRIQVDYENVESIDIKYYIIDPEILFSRTPFLVQDTEDFAYVKPSQTDTAILNPSNKTEMVAIDKDLQTENMIIEITGAGKQDFVRYFSTSLKVIINENYGALKITDQDDKSLPEVYVKVFSQTKCGAVKFFRDGYTDLNGKYEYAQINSKCISDVEKFAIFVNSDEYGAMTKECLPPKSIEIKEIDTWGANPVKFTRKMQ